MWERAKKNLPRVEWVRKKNFWNRVTNLRETIFQTENICEWEKENFS